MPQTPETPERPRRRPRRPLASALIWVGISIGFYVPAMMASERQSVEGGALLLCALGGLVVAAVQGFRRPAEGASERETTPNGQSDLVRKLDRIMGTELWPRKKRPGAQLSDEESTTSSSAGSARVARRPPLHFATPPTGALVEPWIPGRRATAVVGEELRPEAVRAVFRGVEVDPERGAELRGPAVLALDPTHPRGGDAVSVWICGVHVGYLGPRATERYSALVAQLAERGENLAVPSRFWVGRAADAPADAPLAARATITLPEVGAVKPLNELPLEPCEVLPPGDVVQVLREDKHMDVLGPWLRRRNADEAIPIAAVLRAVSRGAAKRRVEVLIDGDVVGELNSRQSVNVLPLIDSAADAGNMAVARASLKGTEKEPELTLYVAKDAGQGPVIRERTTGIEPA